MRLIRLQTSLTDDNNCVFDNSFNTDIIIEPNAKIALQKVAIIKNVELVKVAITAQNNTLTYRLNQSSAPWCMADTESCTVLRAQVRDTQTLR
jgi:hypothetical protein